MCLFKGSLTKLFSINYTSYSLVLINSADIIKYTGSSLKVLNDFITVAKFLNLGLGDLQGNRILLNI